MDVGIQMTLRHYLSTLPLPHGLLESSGIELYYTIIFFRFFTPFNVVNLGFLLIARYMSCKLPSKLAGSNNMNEQLSPSMIIMPNNKQSYSYSLDQDHII